jgi:hypothetical protein
MMVYYGIWWNMMEYGYCTHSSWTATQPPKKSPIGPIVCLFHLRKCFELQNFLPKWSKTDFVFLQLQGMSLLAEKTFTSVEFSWHIIHPSTTGALSLATATRDMNSILSGCDRKLLRTSFAWSWAEWVFWALFNTFQLQKRCVGLGLNL